MGRDGSGRFTVALDKFVQVAKRRTNETVRRIALGVLGSVVAATPVDEGRARGGWQVGLGRRPAGDVPEAEAVARSGSVAEVEGAKLDDMVAGDVCYISNSVPYIRRLEWGWSDQAPSGMVRLTFANIAAIVSEAKRKPAE